ncbi:MAG TPA: N-6 DNA methylase [Anaerolineaceae bacterium]|nr:N-6 DNA methylase [Anaerolineaceae bacterium]HQH85552.1 N-6 DNA methylase [Anaerolineaceae bacterium]
MQTRNRTTFTTIHTEGALLPVDLLQRIQNGDAGLDGLTPESYHLAPGEKLNEAINRSWNRLQGLWGAFETARARLGPADAGTTLTRERWLLPLFQELGFGRLNTARAVEINGKSYPISHRWEAVPLHLVGCGLDLDRRTPGAAGAARISPHSLLQEYLNRADDARWGLLSNGLRLRVLRDNASLTRQAYLEFDLEAMFSGEAYADFVLLWLVCHQSRLETPASGGDCLLEAWSLTARASGARALDDLRSGVEAAIKQLGSGFLRHPANQALKNQLQRGELTTQDYYRQLLRLVYRLIFLFVAEDRDLLLDPTAAPAEREIYLQHYSTARLRRLSTRLRGTRHDDLYEGLKVVMNRLGGDAPQAADRSPLALPVLGGFLFSTAALPHLAAARLDNQALLDAVRSLASLVEGNTRRAVDYRNLGAEELGSVYESLLELHPLLNPDAGTFELNSAAGNERKTTGSYYTPSSLIQVLLDSALEPVIEDRLNGKPGAQQEDALLNLKVCDPACGSGHFLIAAAHRLAGRLAQVRAGGDEPSPNETRRALRDVIRRCIYGVDLNPMAVELCKVNLWLESLEPGKPLSFLDAHIKCGNSLVGVGPGQALDDLEVPDEAFNPVTGDHKPTAAELKKRNRQERAGQESLFVTVITSQQELQTWLAQRSRQMEAMPEDDAAQVRAKADAYEQLAASNEYLRRRQVADLWTAAFFWPIAAPGPHTAALLAPTQGQLRRARRGDPPQPGLLAAVERLRTEVNFFHWPLEFAEVAAEGGFDCVLGNPPWEMLQLEEQEFFASRDPEIASLPGEQRKRAINKLSESNPALAQLFESAKHSADAQNKFFREGSRFALTATGKMNSYALFAEHFRSLAGARGRAGIIVPTGIATDDTTKDFFGDLVDKRAIASLFDFENREKLFPAVDSRMKFCLLTLSALPVKQAQFVFFATRVEHLRDDRRRFTLDPAEIALFNPNTRTMPVFRTRADAELTRVIYQRVPVLVNERTGENPWGVSFKQGLFNMTSDSGLFVTEPREGYVRLYESKLIHLYDHRYATFDEDIKDVSVEDKKDSSYKISPRYWIAKLEVDKQTSASFSQRWFLTFRRFGRSTDERTFINSLTPCEGVGDNLAILNVSIRHTLFACLFGCLASLSFDFYTRFKVGAIMINHFIVRQLPVLPPSSYSFTNIDFILPRVLELTYTAYDLQPFAEDMGYDGDPFPWDEDRRAILRAELDAYYARLYGLTRKQLRYILDPADLTPRELEDILDPREEITDPLDPAGYAARTAASDFPGETFRVLKDKELRQHGEYRTRRLVLEAWERLERDDAVSGGAVNGEWATRTPAPAPARPAPQAQPPPSAPARPKPQAQAPQPQPEPTPAPAAPAAQPTLSDFGLYKCLTCGQMVMGYEKDNHTREQHRGQSVEWKKVR